VRQRSISSKEERRRRTYRDKGIREGGSVVLRIVARLEAIQGVLFSKQGQVLISNSNINDLNFFFRMYGVF
jgi:hypothetical protein